MTDLAQLQSESLRAIVHTMIERAEREGRDVEVDELCAEVLRGHRALLDEYGEAMVRKWVRAVIKDVARHFEAHLVDDAPRTQIGLPGLEGLPLMATVTLPSGRVTLAPVRLFSPERTLSHLAILRTNITRATGVYKMFERVHRLQLEYPAPTLAESMALAASEAVPE